MSNQLWREKYKAVYVSPELHRKLAVQAATEGRQIMEIAEEALADYLKRHPMLPEANESDISVAST